MDTLSTLALSLGTGWASGLNPYAAVLVLGIAGLSGAVQLPADLQVLQSPWVLGAAGVLYAINFFADKVPAIDSVNDFIHTFLRIPAGAVLAAGAAGNLDPAVMVIAGLVGGTLAAGAHTTKTGVRVMANASPEPFSNIGLSFLDDVLAVGIVWVAIKYALVFFVVLAIGLVIMAWLLPKMIRLLVGLFRRFTGRRAAT
ncbi:DUF4126 domain-containing protein [Reyranella sp. CPCC 100927]|uniref:DUF4126 domain-containing protein n=1 Tax=Reyranella sp. CPCC 100927 TaxID=2599616 RepID=UPI0011B539D3|nr:DUF4126 domain-containing protein [Reyranella sp. CPCC 100927]TWT03154.1 DUF4126 domain-containing protein [Reyranella sp. CPCC 100927]